MPPTLIPFRAAHLMQFDAREVGGEDCRLLAELKERSGPAVTAIQDGVILGCGGVAVGWPGVGACWAHFSEALFRHRIWATRMTRGLLAEAVLAHRLHRLETTVLADSLANRRWAEALGFTPETGGLARAYTPDRQDVLRYERLTP